MIIGSYIIDKSLNYDYNKYSKVFGKSIKMVNQKQSSMGVKNDPLFLEVLKKEHMHIETKDKNLKQEFYVTKDSIQRNLELRLKLYLLKSYKKKLRTY